jgi:hypothetical protein
MPGQKAGISFDIPAVKEETPAGIAVICRPFQAASLAACRFLSTPFRIPRST